MKAKSRKRLLISSVAMLLVAMLALGTATFAWFTTDTTARTNNLSVQASKASTLQISRSNNVWGSTVNYEHPDSSPAVLLPTSSANGTDWFFANANSESSYIQKDGTAKKLSASEVSGGTYVFKEQLNIRNAGSAPVKDVKITFQLPNSANYKYVRVALVETNAIGLDQANTGTFSDSVYACDGTAYYAASGLTGSGTTAKLTTTSLTPKSAANTATINVTTGENTLAAATGSGSDMQYPGIKYYNLYVWFEGQDTDCVNANAGVTIPSINFTVTGSAA